MSNTNAVVRQGAEAAFSKEELAGRVRAALEALAKQGIDVFILTSPENIFYLTGQQTPGYYTFQCLLLPVDGEPHFVVRQLELNNLVANSFLENVHPYPDGADSVSFTVDLINKLGFQGKRIAIDERGLVPAGRDVQGTPFPTWNDA